MRKTQEWNWICRDEKKLKQNIFDKVTEMSSQSAKALIRKKEKVDI